MMETHHHNGIMSRKIFSLKLSTETVSLYLLCCGLADAGQELTRKTIAEVWNGTDEQLTKSLSELEKRNILVRVVSGGDEQAEIYRVTEDSRWKTA
jgi:Fic family protein